MEKYQDIISRVSKKYGVPEKLIKQVISVESDWNPKAESGTGPVGLMQVSKALAKDYGYSLEDRFDPEKNIEMGTRYLKDNLKAFKGDFKKALLGYNQGTGGARQILSGKIPIPKEGLNYIKNKKFSPEYISGNASIPANVAPVTEEAPSTEALLELSKTGLNGRGASLPIQAPPKPADLQTNQQETGKKKLTTVGSLSLASSLINQLFAGTNPAINSANMFSDIQAQLFPLLKGINKR